MGTMPVLPKLKPWPIGFWDFLVAYLFSLAAACIPATWLIAYAIVGGSDGPLDAVVDFFLSAMMLIWAPLAAIVVLPTVGLCLLPLAALAVSLFGVEGLRLKTVTLLIGAVFGSVVGIAALIFEQGYFQYPFRAALIFAVFGVSGAFGAYVFRMMILFKFPNLIGLPPRPDNPNIRKRNYPT